MTDHALLLQTLDSMLAELGAVVQALGARTYTQKASPQGQSSIGAHIRHSLDHFRILLDSVGQPGNAAVRYDRRERNTEIESSSSAALRSIAQLRSQLQKLDATDLDVEIQIEHMIHPDGSMQTFRSSLARELFFAGHHLIHHNAIIQSGSHLPMWPDGFGSAPATTEFRHSQEKAAST
ncbi:MAG: DinB family protein [Leptospiraceae bacterium]|nr:DinB family protein [Leptospiraceae bacterium]